MTIFVVIKAALSMTGEQVFVTTEKAFKEQAQAQAWCAGKPAVWEEMIGNIQCYAEHAVHTIELE